MVVNIISGPRLIVMTQDLFYAKPISLSLDAVFLKITTPLFQVRLKLNSNGGGVKYCLSLRVLSVKTIKF